MNGHDLWARRQRRYEREARHARFRNSVEAGVLRAFAGALVGGALVMVLQWAGVLS